MVVCAMPVLVMGGLDNTVLCEMEAPGCGTIDEDGDGLADASPGNTSLGRGAPAVTHIWTNSATTSYA